MLQISRMSLPLCLEYSVDIFFANPNIQTSGVETFPRNGRFAEQ